MNATGLDRTRTEQLLEARRTGPEEIAGLRTEILRLRAELNHIAHLAPVDHNYHEAFIWARHRALQALDTPAP